MPWLWQSTTYIFMSSKNWEILHLGKPSLALQLSVHNGELMYVQMSDLPHKSIAYKAHLNMQNRK